MVGWPKAVSPFGNPNAHFSFRLGTSVAVRPALFADAKRVLPRSALHPFHEGPADGSANGGLVGQRLDIDSALPECFASSGRPPRYSAMRRFSSALSPRAGSTMTPVVIAASTDSGVSCIRAFRSGARSATGGPTWHEAQFRSNSV